MALSERGNLFIWGANGKGQLGLYSKEDILTPLKVSLDDEDEGDVPDLFNDVEIATAGTWSTVFFTSKSKTLHIWGSDFEVNFKRQLTDFKKSHDDIAMLEMHGGNIISYTGAGELLNYNIEKDAFTKLDEFSNIHSLSIGTTHTAIVNKDYAVLTSGSNNSG
jgi:alpha-tubulin suppressor-like RCC1 family protein